MNSVDTKRLDLRIEKALKSQYLEQQLKLIKEKNQTKSNIESLKNRNDELGLLSNSLEDMTNELQKRIDHIAEFAADVAHELKNPITSVRSASETITKVKKINKPYARKIQILTVLEQRAAVQGKAEQSRLAKKAKETLRKQRGTSKKST